LNIVLVNLCRKWEDEICASVTTKESHLDAILRLITAEEQSYLRELALLVSPSSVDIKETFAQASECLKRAAALCGHGLKAHPRSAALHYRMGLFIEEKTIVERLFNSTDFKTKSEAGGKIGGPGLVDGKYRDTELGFSCRQ
jgi:hypothetical protein